MGSGITVKGIEETMSFLDELRRDYPRKVVVSAMKNAQKPFVKEIIARNSDIPEIKKEAKSRTIRRTGKDVVVASGIWGGESSATHISSKGKQPMRVFHLVYWRNYGTLSNRNTLHRFVRSRKHKSARWSGGIAAEKSIEKAWEKTKSMVINNLPIEAKKAAEKYLAKRGKV